MDGTTVIEYEFVTALLADPHQLTAVEHVQPQMIQDRNLREVYTYLRSKSGRITQGTLLADLQATPSGKNALLELAAGMECDSDVQQAVETMFSDGFVAGSIDLLAERVHDAALVRQARDAFQTMKPDQYQDASEYVISLAANLNNLASKSTVATGNSLSSGIQQVLQQWMHQKDNPDLVPGWKVNTGEYDHLIGGLKPGELVMICGHSGEGKSQVMMHMALEAALATHDHHGRSPVVAYFSLEMNDAQVTKRWMSKLAGFDIGSRFLTPEQEARVPKAASMLEQLAADRKLIVIEPQACHTLEQITREMNRLKHNDGLDIAFVDYVQLIRVTGAGSSSKYDQLGQIAQRLKTLSIQLDIPIVTAVQLNREAMKDSASGWPKRYHIADSLDLLRSADMVSFIWRPDKHLGRDSSGPWQGIAVLMVDKMRSGDDNVPWMYFLAEYDKATLTPVNDGVRMELNSREAQSLLLRRRVRAEWG